MVLAWGGWAGVQSTRHGLARYERVFPLEPWALVVAVTLAWPVALPWFLRLRHRILTGRLQAPLRPSRARYALVACALLLPHGAHALPKLLEQLPWARELAPIERAATTVAGEPVHVALESGGALTITVLHAPVEGELHEERADVAHRIAEAVVLAAGEKPSFRLVRIAFATVRGPPGMTVSSVDDVFEWPVAELRRAIRV